MLKPEYTFHKFNNKIEGTLNKKFQEDPNSNPLLTGLKYLLIAAFCLSIIKFLSPLNQTLLCILLFTQVLLNIPDFVYGIYLSSSSFSKKNKNMQIKGAKILSSSILKSIFYLLLFIILMKLKMNPVL